MAEISAPAPAPAPDHAADVISVAAAKSNEEITEHLDGIFRQIAAAQGEAVAVLG